MSKSKTKTIDPNKPLTDKTAKNVLIDRNNKFIANSKYIYLNRSNFTNRVKGNDRQLSDIVVSVREDNIAYAKKIMNRIENSFVEHTGVSSTKFTDAIEQNQKDILAYAELFFGLKELEDSNRGLLTDEDKESDITIIGNTLKEIFNDDPNLILNKKNLLKDFISPTLYTVLLHFNTNKTLRATKNKKIILPAANYVERIELFKKATMELLSQIETDGRLSLLQKNTYTDQALGLNLKDFKQTGADNENLEKAIEAFRTSVKKLTDIEIKPENQTKITAAIKSIKGALSNSVFKSYAMNGANSEMIAALEASVVIPLIYKELGNTVGKLKLMEVTSTGRVPRQIYETDQIDLTRDLQGEITVRVKGDNEKYSLKTFYPTFSVKMYSEDTKFEYTLSQRTIEKSLKYLEALSHGLNGGFSSIALNRDFRNALFFGILYPYTYNSEITPAHPMVSKTFSTQVKDDSRFSMIAIKYLSNLSIRGLLTMLDTSIRQDFFILNGLMIPAPLIAARIVQTLLSADSEKKGAGSYLETTMSSIGAEGNSKYVNYQGLAWVSNKLSGGEYFSIKLSKPYESLYDKKNTGTKVMQARSSIINEKIDAMSLKYTLPKYTLTDYRNYLKNYATVKLSDIIGGVK